MISRAQFRTIIGGCVLLACSLQAWAQETATPSAAAYAEEVQEGMSAIVPLLPEYVTRAEEVARYMVAGGTLWLAGDHGFVFEGLNRAGGLMASKQLKPADELKPGDIMLYGLLQAATPEDVEALQNGMDAGVLCLAFGPVQPENHEVRYLRVPVAPADDPDKLPVVSPVQATVLWTFSAELVSALTRIGKMPPMWQSVMVEGGRERNAEHLKLTWEPGVPEPVAPILLGRTYLARMSNFLQRLRATQLDKFVAAGALAADATAAGHVAWYACLGHMLPDMPGQIGDPGILTTLSVRKPEKLGEFVNAGDVIMYVGYYEPYGPWVEQAHALGAKIVTVVSGTPERSAEDMGADINISGCWPFGDATIEVPGYDISVLPPSGVIQSAAYWMLVAESACATK
jgi:uncharacterized phosphosugar-binding protein